MTRVSVQDSATMDALCAALRTTRTYSDAAASLGLTKRQVAGLVYRLRERNDPRLPLPRVAGAQLKPLPDDFAELALSATSLQLRAHYGVSGGIIARWRREAGVPAPTFPRATRTLKVSAPASNVRLVAAPSHRATRLRLDRDDARDMSRAGQAVDFLRRFGPVYRCDEQGNPEGKPTHWRRGSFVLTDAEIIERAERNGWQPDAWRTLAPTNHHEGALAA